MLLSVAICTWNRANLLEKTLDQLRNLAIQHDQEWELLVVNNNCSDNTDAILQRFQTVLPLRRLFEPRPGLSNARNCAVSAALGQFVIWTDDDVLVTPQWLGAYATAFAKYPDACIFGGPVEAWFEVPPPKWLERTWKDISSAYAVRDFGPESIPISKEIIPFGANFAVRRDWLVNYPFDPTLGVRPTSRMGFEETTVIEKMLGDGASGYWVPEARVQHYIPRSRLTKRYVRRIFYSVGEFDARQDAGKESNATRLLGMPLRKIPQALKAELKYQIRQLYAEPELWMKDLIRASILWGRMR